MNILRQKLMVFSLVMIAAAAIIGSLGWYQSVYADTTTSTPGSTDDPIVTKSYVDKQVAELVQQELAKLGSAGGGGGASSNIEVVTVKLGQKIIVADGGELIVR